MSGCVLALVLYAAASSPSLATPGLRALGLPKESADIYTEHLAQRLTSKGIRVITSREMQLMLGLEKQKELLGCAEDGATCSAELGAALGVDGILSGDLIKSGAVIQLNVKVIGVTSKVLALDSRSAPSEDALLDTLNASADALAEQLGRPAVAAAVEARSTRLFWLPAVAGVALLGAGIGLELAAQSNASTLRNPAGNLSDAAAVSARDSGRLEQSLGAVCFIASAVAIAAAVVLFVLGW